MIRVLAAYGADLGKVALDGNTPLHYAAQRGFGPICKFLSQRGQYLVDTQYRETKYKKYLTMCSHHALCVPLVSKLSYKWVLCDQEYLTVIYHSFS